jgi:beta-phosphoglucomutase-like phosphatase (HAD superfamily)
MTAAALLFDMDGTMVDSMPVHARSWEEFARRHGIALGVDEILRRTTGRTGVECMREIFERPLADGEARMLVDEKESIYRDLFAPVFREVAGFCSFAAAAAGRANQNPINR